MIDLDWCWNKKTVQLSPGKSFTPKNTVFRNKMTIYTDWFISLSWILISFWKPNTFKYLKSFKKLYNFITQIGAFIWLKQCYLTIETDLFKKKMGIWPKFFARGLMSARNEPSEQSNLAPDERLLRRHGQSWNTSCISQGLKIN